MPHNRIRSRRQPFEVAVLLAAPPCGLLLIVLDVRPPSVTLAMDTPIQVLWEAGLIVGGVIGLSGIIWPGRLATGLGIELAAVVLLGTITAMYAAALAAVSGRSGTAAISFIVAVSVGSFWRAGQIVLDLRLLAAASRTTDTDPEIRTELANGEAA
ncbi:hypothetical protein [Micromonospora sp. NPDC005367]|uniref:hypothetical protein n=1 Tax=Micromonospora sp. NPDC005367 TaxID=3155590 RepID=UPI0033AAB8F7